MQLNRRQAVVLVLSSMVGFQGFVFAETARTTQDEPIRTECDERLANGVTIYRDEYGVPHIVGETEEAAFFGYGYAQAEDHLERMMLQYRDAQGRRAEVQGFEALGDGYLHFIPYEYRWDGDYLQRLMRTKRGVVENRDKIDPEVYKLPDAFARGVNSYIAAEDVEALERSRISGSIACTTRW